MVANIIVAVACNLVALLVLLSGLFSAKSNGLKVTLVKLFFVVGGVVGSYFLTPVISDKLYNIEKVPELFSQIGISKGSINSCIFLAFFLVVYALALGVCSIVKHALIKKMQNKKLNKAKMKRAQSINPSAEKAVRKAEWKAAKRLYKEKRKWYSQLFACLLGIVVALATGIIMLMPFGYIGKDINVKSGKTYLVDGFEYTLNGLIPESVFDWAVHKESSVTKDPESELPEEPETPEDSVEPEVPEVTPEVEPEVTPVE